MFKCDSLPLEEPAGPRPAARRLELTLGRVSGKDGVEAGVAAGMEVVASRALEDVGGGALALGSAIRPGPLSRPGAESPVDA